MVSRAVEEVVGAFLSRLIECKVFTLFFSFENLILIFKVMFFYSKAMELNYLRLHRLCSIMFNGIY